MKRLTSDNCWEMDMVQLALNQVYVKDGWTWYRNGPEDELSICDLIRRAAEALEVELPVLSDDDLSDLLADWLYYGTDEPEGVLAILYRALWAMAEVRATLQRYEDTGLGPDTLKEFAPFLTEMQENMGAMRRLKDLASADKDGRLAVLPCKKGDTLWSFYNYPAKGISKIEVTAVSTLDGITVINTDNYGVISEKDIGDTVFLTREEAETVLRKRLV